MFGDFIESFLVDLLFAERGANVLTGGVLNCYTFQNGSFRKVG